MTSPFIEHRQKWSLPKLTKIRNCHRFFDIFEKFHNLVNIFLTKKFDLGNEKLKEPLSYKMKNKGLFATVFSVFSVEKRQHFIKLQKIAKSSILFKKWSKKITKFLKFNLF